MLTISSVANSSPTHQAMTVSPAEFAGDHSYLRMNVS